MSAKCLKPILLDDTKGKLYNWYARAQSKKTSDSWLNHQLKRVTVLQKSTKTVVVNSSSVFKELDIQYPRIKFYIPLNPNFWNKYDLNYTFASKFHHVSYPYELLPMS